MRRVRRDSVRKIADSTSLRVALSRRSRERRHHALARQPDARHFVFDGEVNQNIGEQRMDVKVQMAVDMVEVADQLEMPLDLRAQLVGHRGAHRAVEEISHAGGDRTVDELARRAHCGAKPRAHRACCVLGKLQHAARRRASGLSRASSAAARAAGSATIRLALRKIPSRCARVIPALTSGDKPKSSALTMRRFKPRHRDQSRKTRARFC